MIKFKSAPSFRVDKKSKPPRVFLRCSQCDVDIRELKMSEKISVTRAYHCKDCDQGVVVLNPPTSNKMEKDE